MHGKALADCLPPRVPTDLRPGAPTRPFGTARSLGPPSIDWSRMALVIVPLRRYLTASAGRCSTHIVAAFDRGHGKE